MLKGQILVVDDEANFRDLLYNFLSKAGYEVNTFSNGEEAIEAAKRTDFDLVLLDLIMPGMDGIEVLRRIKELNNSILSIILTGHADVDSAVKAMKIGAFDYIGKPFNLEEILFVINKAMELKRLQNENVALKKELRSNFNFEKIIGASDEMIKIFHLMERVTDSDSTVLISGESGTGKDLIAQALHYNSSRKDKLFVPVNCGAIPEDLLESELFGHVKGAFTGAVNSRVGRFQLADGGTIFLDEIGEMSPKLQVKLLRVLQDKEIDPVGGVQRFKVDVRVLAATNCDLEKAVENKLFREDLFYRLNVIPIQVPSLRERKSDILLLVNHFLGYFNRIKKTNIEEIAPEVMKIFMEYPWPGNVRELENLMERLVILNFDKRKIEPEDLPEKYTGKQSLFRFPNIKLPDDGFCINTFLNQIENELILQALNKSGWVKERAARMLNLNRTTLVEKLKRKNLGCTELRKGMGVVND